MRSIIGLAVLLVVMAGMFAVVLPQNSNTRYSNAVPNVNYATRNNGRPSNSHNGNLNYRYPGAWVDGNTNRPLVNGTWNANSNQWDIDANALYSANALANSAVNANRPAPKKPRRKRARPAMAFSMSIENSLLTGLLAGVKEE